MGVLWGLLKTVAAWLTRNGMVALFVLGVATTAYHFWKDEHDGRVAAELQAQHQRALNDSTQIVQASERIQHRKEIEGLLTAEREMQGKLIAALKIAIAQRDTTIIHHGLPTDTLPNGTRTATFADSTFAGKLAGTVTAPPYPAPLGLAYTLTRPAFTPEIGFVRVGNKTIATVVWQGETYKIESAYFDPNPVPSPRLTPFVAAQYDLLRPAAVISGGVEFRLPWHLWATATASQRVGIETGPSLLVGGKRTF